MTEHSCLKQHVLIYTGLLSQLMLFSLLSFFLLVYSSIIFASTERVSVASDGAEAISFSGDDSSISADGRYIVFSSTASNLVTGDIGGNRDVFLHDRVSNITKRISVASDGTEGNHDSENPSISADGRYVVFQSSASNLVTGDMNGTFPDIFVHDLNFGTTTRVSVSSNGSEANSPSFNPIISANGRYVVFQSAASNLVVGDTNEKQDIFIHDRVFGMTERVSVDSNAIQANDHSFDPYLSADGQVVTFMSVANNLVPGDTQGSDIFVHDRSSGSTVRVSVASDGTQANDSSSIPSISADGQYVVFESYATNLVASDNNNTSDIFVHDRNDGSTTRVSVASNGTEGNFSSLTASITPDGHFVSFVSDASNLVDGDSNGVADLFVHDRIAGITSRISVANDGAEANGWSGLNYEIPAMSADGHTIAFTSSASNLVVGDTNSTTDVFVVEIPNISRVSVDSSGNEGNGSFQNAYRSSVSADGRIVVFESDATNLVSGDSNGNNDIFVHDRSTGVTTRMSVASNGTQSNNDCNNPAISADGRYVTFESYATNLVSGDSNNSRDIFVHDRNTGVTSRVSVASNGTPADLNSSEASISEDGRYVSFYSSATNLVSGDTNNVRDVFVHDRNTGVTTRVSVSSSAAQGNGHSASNKISADGNIIAFASSASNLVENDTNSKGDLFVHNRTTGNTTRVSVATDGTQTSGDSQISLSAISGDGNVVLFESNDINLIAVDNNGSTFDHFVHVVDTAVTSLVSIATDGTQGNGSGNALKGSLSFDGNIVAFGTQHSNLVTEPDTNSSAPDVFIHNRFTGVTNRISNANDGTQGNNTSDAPSLSADGSVVIFRSFSSNLVDGDNNNKWDAFVVDITPSFLLNVTNNGNGSVTDDFGLINCGSDCAGGYSITTNVTLNAVPDAGFIFTGWSGACSGTASCQLTMLSDVTVSASFDTDIDGDGIGDSLDPAIDILDGDVTLLIAAINAANDETEFPGVDVINLASNGTYQLISIEDTSNGNSGLPAINSEIVINGNGASLLGGPDNNTCDGVGNEFRILTITASGNLTLNSTTVSGGCLYSAGGIDGNLISGGGIGVFSGNLNLNDSFILNNSGLFIGGGLYSNAGDVIINNSTISNNVNTYGGGGIGLFNEADLTINNSTVTNNVTQGTGGGIDNSSSTLTIVNSTISNNSADLNGGGVDNSSGLLTISNSTVYGNISSTGGGINSFSADTFIIHSTIVENEATSSGGGLYIFSADNAVIKNSLISNNIASSSSSSNCRYLSVAVSSASHNLYSPIASGCPTTGNGNIVTANAYFSTLKENGGFNHTVALLAGSPAINAIPFADCTDINDNSLTEDQRGFIRPDLPGGNCDIGAFEYDSNDNDADGIPNDVDSDDDNDGLSDTTEATLGTNPLLADTDFDGVIDSTDEFPLDPNEQVDTDSDGTGDNADTSFDVADNDIATLIASIDAANNETNNPGIDVINLATGGSYPLTTINNNDDGNTGLPAITSEIIIKGNGASISGSAENNPCDGNGVEFRIFLVSSTNGKLTLNNTTVSGGCTFGSDGGGILVDGGTLNLNNSSVSDTSGQPDGGIYSNTGSVTISR
jgi:Tol biopolymer transport system component